MASLSTLALERVELLDDESEDDFKYDGVSDPDADSDGGDDDDLDKVVRASRSKPAKAETLRRDAPAPVTPCIVDDFIRNYLIKAGLARTLAAFNAEWYEKLSRGTLRPEDATIVPDVYVRNQELDAQVKVLSAELEKHKEIAARAQGTWDTFRKERDFHRTHHKRVVQEKGKLVNDLKRLKKHFDAYEPTLTELRSKYEVAMKEKMLMMLEKDRIQTRLASLQSQVGAFEEASKAAAAAAADKTAPAAPRRKRRGADAVLPTEAGSNPYAAASFERTPIERLELSKTFKGHANSVSAVAWHPKKAIIATASDDATWKLWTVPDGELVMAGEGHKEWLSGVDFHPAGTHLATCAGNGEVKVWDFASAACVSTFTDHTQAAWGVAFHHSGDFLASCSMDHSARLWDLSSQRCRQPFRGHVDSVNAVVWQPYTNNLCTCSGDKTVSIWDARTGLCAQTFYGHANAVSDVVFNLRGDSLASCDANGVVKLWDVRAVSERASLDAGEAALNKVAFDRSGQTLAAASDDGTVKLFNLSDNSAVGALHGHEDAVQSVAFDITGKYLVSAGSDNTFRVWTAP